MTVGTVESLHAFYHRVLDAQIPESVTKSKFVAAIAMGIDRYAYRLVPKIGQHIDGVKQFNIVVAHGANIETAFFYAIALKNANDSRHLVCIVDALGGFTRNRGCFGGDLGHSAQQERVEIAVGTPAELSKEISRISIAAFMRECKTPSARELLAFANIFARVEEAPHG